MVSAKSRRGLIKPLCNATGATKGNRCFIGFNKPILLLTFAINDSICSYMLIPSQILMNDNTEILDWIFALKVFVINGKLDTLAGFQPAITTKKYELGFRCIWGLIVVVYPFDNIGKVGIQAVFNILTAMRTEVNHCVVCIHDYLPAL